MAYSLIEHGDDRALIAAVAARLASALDDALALRNTALLALAGGRTSPPIFRSLAAQARDWRAVHVVPSDERWVARAHADSNLRQMQEAFTAAAGIDWIALAPPLPGGAPDAHFANSALVAHAAEFDATLLRMRADGTFPSLLPGAPNLAAGLDPQSRDAAIAIMPDPMPAAGPHPRISLTLARLLRSRRVLLAIGGADKRATLEHALRENDPLRHPVAALLHAPQAEVEIHWSP